MPGRRPLSALTIALAGLVALGVAMGIGRFAFTPLLPMMLAEGTVDLPGASLLASANYLGYLLGALACTFQPWITQRWGWGAGSPGPRWVRYGLVATVLLTLSMASPWTGTWTMLRFAAGVASAVVFLYTSGFCLEQTARQGVASLGALIYCGPGLGIVVSGLAATLLVQGAVPAAWGWLTFGVLAALMTAAVWPIFDVRRVLSGAAPAPSALSPGHDGSPNPSGAAAGAAEPRPVGGLDMGLLTLAYGLAGIGYIITATFLPVIARQALPGSHALDLFWPLFGGAATVGAWVASRLPAGRDQRWRLVACYVIQSLGVAAGLMSPTPAGFALGSILLGLPFTAITYFAMQEVRRVRPLQAVRFMGLLTAAYGLGQIAGPPMAAWFVGRSPNPAAGFTAALWIAAALLMFGAVLYGLLAYRHPLATGKGVRARR